MAEMMIKVINIIILIGYILPLVVIDRLQISFSLSMAL
jgi:hypothetical protein